MHSNSIQNDFEIQYKIIYYERSKLPGIFDQENGTYVLSHVQASYTMYVSCRVMFETEIAKIALDAKRYQWLRYGDNDEKVMKFLSVGDPYLLRNEKLDVLIDSQIREDLLAKLHVRPVSMSVQQACNVLVGKYKIRGES